MRKWSGLIALLAGFAAHAACGDHGVALQVLGSGGPVAGDKRASSGYLVWRDGHARVLVDAGGGVFLRFGESGAKLEDLRLIAITHLHADHVGDLMVLEKSSFFSDRTQALPISGPSGGGDFPGLNEFLRAQFDAKNGAFRYLSGALDGGAGEVQLAPKEIPAQADAAVEVFADGDLHVDAIGVPHGPVPALAYRVEIGGMRVVFSGDQNGSKKEFWDFARDADLLVMAHPVPENADPVARKLHAVPSVIGAGAANAQVKRMLLSHLMARSLDTLDANIAIMRRAYTGPIDVAQDLRCYEMKKIQ